MSLQDTTDTKVTEMPKIEESPEISTQPSTPRIQDIAKTEGKESTTVREENPGRMTKKTK